MRDPDRSNQAAGTKRRQDRPSFAAYHEAGHAVACWRYGLPVSYVTIEPDECEGIGGMVRVGPSPPGDELKRLHEAAVMTFSGPAAQRRSHPRSGIMRSARRDHAQCLALALGAHASIRPIRQFLRQAREEARDLVDRHWFAVDQVARALMERRALSGFALSQCIVLAEAEWAQARVYWPGKTAADYAKLREGRKA